MGRVRLHHVGATIVVVFFVAAWAGPWVAPYAPAAMDLRHAYELPSRHHWLGTTDNGIDLLSALLHGARLAAVIGISVVSLSVLIGAVVGMIAGFWGGLLDDLLVGLADTVQSFPSILLNIAMLAWVERPGVPHIIAVLSMNGWVLYARLVRAKALAVRELDYVMAAKALGFSRARIAFRHVLPVMVPPLVVQATAGFGGVVLVESSLSFLGIGPGVMVSWGALLDQGTAVLLRFPHVAMITGTVLATTVMGFQLAGDRLADRVDAP
jgi:peptide/nickel transport system permease protein